MPLLSTFFLVAVSSVGALVPPPPSSRQVAAAPDYDIYPFTTTTESDLTWYSVVGKIPSTGRAYIGHIATFEPSAFSFRPPTVSGCDAYVKTSVSSYETWNCSYATNGGFFSWDETLDSKCVGNLITDGEVIILDGYEHANFGITKDNRIFTGFADDVTTAALDFKHLLSGYGWLVRNGSSYVSSSADLDITSTFVVEKAPRTSVGVFDNGSMILFEVDGQEAVEFGPDLFEFAELLVGLGVASAVNIDGGGSSVSVSRGEVISRPTCDDIVGSVCEREVQSITCVA